MYRFETSIGLYVNSNIVLCFIHIYNQSAVNIFILSPTVYIYIIYLCVDTSFPKRVGFDASTNIHLLNLLPYYIATHLEP